GCSFTSSADHPDLHSFPTRRSSDLPRITTMGSSSSGPLVRNAKNSQPNTAMPTNPNAVVGLRPMRSEIQPHSGPVTRPTAEAIRSEEHTSELQSRENLVCRLLLEKK